MALCPCGSGIPYEGCCGPVLDGAVAPATAEGLMRSGYTAHTCADMDYLVRTHEPSTRHDIDVEGTRRWAQRAEWLGLEIRACEAGGADDSCCVQ
jgi:SEC-C motif-containing protein